MAAFVIWSLALLACGLILAIFSLWPGRLLGFSLMMVGGGMTVGLWANWWGRDFSLPTHVLGISFGLLVASLSYPRLRNPEERHLMVASILVVLLIAVFCQGKF